MTKHIILIMMFLLLVSAPVLGQEEEGNTTLIWELKDIYPIDTTIISDKTETESDNQSVSQHNEADLKRSYGEKNHLKLSFIHIFHLSVKPDEDRNEIDMGIEFEHQVQSGDGYGISVELPYDGSNENGYTNCGFLFLTTSHKETQTHEDVYSHSCYFEWNAGGTSSLNDELGVNFSISGGVGLAVFDFNDEQNDSTSGAAEVRASVGIELFQRLEFGLIGGTYLWGYPSETVGYGSFFGARASVIF